MSKTQQRLAPMKQLEAYRKANPEALPIVRMGDFYEFFGDDARLASKLLGLTLLSRSRSDDTPMCGFPHHQRSVYIRKLRAEGHKAVALKFNRGKLVEEKI